MKNILAKSLNIAIIPDKETQDLAIEMSKKVNKNIDCYFTLNNTNFLPHITIYQAYFPEKNIEVIKDNIHKIIRNKSPFSIDLNNFSIVNKTFLFWKCVKSKQLSDLQNQVIKNTNSLRNGLILPMLSNSSDIPEKYKSDIEQYGSLLIGPNYIPHITITRIKDEEDSKKAIELMRNKKQSFKANEIILGALGENGTVTEILEKFVLK